jgi:hypothetical protein
MTLVGVICRARINASSTNDIEAPVSISSVAWPAAVPGDLDAA